MRINGYGVGTDAVYSVPTVSNSDGGGYGGLVRKRRSATGMGVGVGERDNSSRPNGRGNSTPSFLYTICPFAYLTFRGRPEDATFENFSLHLQVEQLVHRRTS